MSKKNKVYGYIDEAKDLFLLEYERFDNMFGNVKVDYSLYNNSGRNNIILELLLNQLEDGDTLVIKNTIVLGNSLVKSIETLLKFLEKGVTVRILNENIIINKSDIESVKLLKILKENQKHYDFLRSINKNNLSESIL